MALVFYIMKVLCEQVAHMRYFDRQGSELRDVDKVRDFIAYMDNGSLKLYLKSSQNPYFTNLQVFEDPCENRIEGVFNSAKGYYNRCTKKMEFMFRNNYYKVDTGKYTNNIDILPFKLAPPRLKESSTNSTDSSDTTLFDTNEQTEQTKTVPSDSSNKLLADQAQTPYHIKLFIFNNMKRSVRLGKTVVKNTKKILEEVNTIFMESKIPITIELTGILNFEQDKFLTTTETPLTYFKNTIEPTRFSRFNLSKSLAKCNLTLLIAEENNKKDLLAQSDLKIHGMSYMAGSVRLDSSYAVVLTNEKDSTYFIAKKIAHEIGHTLNASHVDDTSIMEKTTCRTCGDSKRQFSEHSRTEIISFLLKNSRVFKTKIEKKYKDDGILKTEKDAIEYAEERRRHSFSDIVKTRLRNIPPNLINDGPNPYLVLLLYSFLLMAVFYYWK